jgi:cyclopropane fatty-acyl-phospholipid synthase-like methyltransferase
MGYHVISTTLSPQDVKTAALRIESMKTQGLSAKLQFRACPMETVHEHVGELGPFDAVFVFEALHHAFDWKASLASAFSCLRPGGWLLICSEPNYLHTAISYRVGKLSNTHEIGFWKGELTAQLRRVGFRRVYSRGKRPHCLFHLHWLMAQR